MAKICRSITLVADGEKNAVTVWEPEVRPRAIVQIVHGMREHMGRYREFAEFLTAQGFVVGGNDHKGHGRTCPSPEEFGFFGEEGGPNRLIRNCHLVTRLLQKEYPELPLFLLGHSMGSFIAKLYVLRYPSGISGFICMGTSGGNRQAAVGRAAAEGLIRAQGARAPAKILHHMAFKDFNKRCSLEGDSMAWLSRDSETVRSYKEDPLIRPYLSNSGFRDMIDMEMAAAGKQWAEMADPDLPVLFISGEEDPLGGYGRGVAQAYTRLLRAGATDVELKLFPGARHELLGELNREEVFYYLYIWMNRYL